MFNVDQNLTEPDCVDSAHRFTMETERCRNPPLTPTNGASAESHVGGGEGRGPMMCWERGTVTVLLCSSYEYDTSL